MFHGVQERRDVSDRVRARAVSPVAVVHDTGDVVVEEEAGEADFLQRSYRLDDVDIALSEEALLERRNAPLTSRKWT